MVVFLDMDGVIADFARSALAANGITDYQYSELTQDIAKQFCENEKQEQEFYEKLQYDFWVNLPKTAEADFVVDLLHRLYGEDLAIASSPLRISGCAQGKIDWLKKNFPFLERRLLLGKPKYLMAAPDKLLIDDLEENIERFESRGGRGLLFPRPWNRDRHLLLPSGDVSEETFRVLLFQAVHR